MGKVRQERGERGSLKWIQDAVASNRQLLEQPMRAIFPDLGAIEWLSPLANDDFAEYRDSAFLERLGLPDAAKDLRAFWPERGPQWDALARSGDTCLLFEAKAHLPEAFSAPTQASDPKSLAMIRGAFARVVADLGANPIADWERAFYQYANRITHLYFLREVLRVDARLVFVDFVGDAEMGGPDTPAEWRGAYTMMDHVLGLRRSHRLSRYIAHIHPDVTRMNRIP